VRLFLFYIFICLGLIGCSSPIFRAPVVNITSAAHHKTLFSSSPNKKGAYSARNLKTYKVKKGDTLYGIAWKMGIDINTLAKINNLKSPYTIYEDQKLNLTKTKEVKRYSQQTVKVKNKATSQKSDKNKANNCSNQKCIKKVNNKVVLEKTKGYSAVKGNENVAQKIAKTAKVVQAVKTKPVTKKISNWLWPAQGKVIKTFSSSQVGMKGISIANRRGTAIYATTAGTVVYAGSGLQGYGKLIIIKHNYDYLSAYAHNDKLLVHENEQIKAGQKIATMGDSSTDNVHLHFEIRYRGKSVDPLRYLTKR